MLRHAKQVASNFYVFSFIKLGSLKDSMKL